MHRVAHDQRGLGRVDDDDGLAFFGAAHLLDGAGGGAGKFVNVFARAGAYGLGGRRGDNFGIGHGLDAGHRCHQRDRRLPAAGHHVDVHRAAFEVGRQVDRRHAVGADGGRGEVDHQHAQLIELAAVFGMHVGRGCVEGNLDVVAQHMGQQAIHAVTGGVEAHVPGPHQSLGRGVDAHHPHRFQHLAAQQFVKQVGADVAGPDQGTFDLFGHH